MKRTVLISFAALLVAMFLCVGCDAFKSEETAGVLNYTNGCLELTVDHPSKEVAKATEKAIEKLKIVKSSSNLSELCADFEGRTVDGDKVRIVIDAAGSNRSNLSIHVGFFGSEDESIKIFNEIRMVLGDPERKLK